MILPAEVTCAMPPCSGRPRLSNRWMARHLASGVGPSLAIHARCSLAIVFRHSFHGQYLGRARVDQEPMQGFHPAPVLITSCLGDTNLQSPHPTVYDGPIDLIPCATAGEGLQNPFSRISYLLASCRMDSAYALAIPHPTEVRPPSGGTRCLLSEPLQPGVRLLRDPSPAAYSRGLRRAYPTGRFGREDNGFTEVPRQ
jgi:hypothetical protein